MRFYHCIKFEENWLFSPENKQNKTELLYYLNGSVTVKMNGVEYTVKGGEMIVIPPNVSHEERSETGINVIAILCDFDRSCDVLTEGTIVRFPEHMRPLFNMLLKEYEHSVVISEAAESIFELIIHFAQYIVRARDVNPYVSQMLKFIRGNYTDPDLILKDSFSFIPMAPDYLRRLFSAETGQRPHEYLENMRLGRSRQLLSATNDMISEVAYKVGYSDPIYFARRFKAKYGVSPSDYRKNERLSEESDNG